MGVSKTSLLLLRKVKVQQHMSRFLDKATENHYHKLHVTDGPYEDSLTSPRQFQIGHTDVLKDKVLIPRTRSMAGSDIMESVCVCVCV
jgi:hypothetical protein